MPSRIERSQLVGAKFVGSIGEPWDFESEAGAGRIVGTITGVADPTESPAWVRLSISPFHYESAEVREVLAVARYERGVSFLSDLASGERVGANMYFRFDGKPFVGRVEFSDLASSGGRTFLVGSLQLKI